MIFSFHLTILWKFLSIFAATTQPTDLPPSTCFLNEITPTSMMDADLICHNVTLNQNTLHQLTDFKAEDVEVVGFLDIDIELNTEVLKSLTSLKSLMLHNSRVSVFKPESSLLLNLQVHHTAFPNNSNFDDCCKNLNKLYLKNCTGIYLENSVFTKLKRLQQLQLSRMHIEHLSRDIFRGLRSLKKLRISNTNFTKLDHDSFADLTKLTELSIEENEIEDIDNDIFKPLRKLRVLTIHAKKLKAMPIKMFKGLRNLTNLGLPLATWREMDVEQIPELFPHLVSYSYTEEWEEKDADIYRPLFIKLSKLLINQ